MGFSIGFGSKKGKSKTTTKTKGTSTELGEILTDQQQRTVSQRRGTTSQESATNRTGTTDTTQTGQTQTQSELAGATETAGQTTGRTSGTQTTRGATDTQIAGATDVVSSLSQLDEGTQLQLQNLVSQLGIQAGDLTGLQADRAAGADAALGDTVQAIVAEAERKGELELGNVRQALSRGAGSSLNTIVQQLGLEEAGNIESRTRALEAELEFQRRQVATGEIAAAAGGATSGVANLANILKGASQEQTQQQTQQQTQTGTQEQTALNEQLSEEIAQQTATQQQTQQTAQQTQQQTQAVEVIQELASIFGTEDVNEIQSLVASIAESRDIRKEIDETTTGKTKSKSGGFSLGLS